MMINLFKDIIPSILVNKNNVIKDSIDLKEYNPFLVNRALSYHLDCLPYANEMNFYRNLDKDMQYQYLLNSIRPMKRGYVKWQTAEVDSNIQCVKTYFGYSSKKAKEALKILTKEQIAEIKIKTDIGGVKSNE